MSKSNPDRLKMLKTTIRIIQINFTRFPNARKIKQSLISFMNTEANSWITDFFE